MVDEPPEEGSPEGSPDEAVVWKDSKLTKQPEQVTVEGDLPEGVQGRGAGGEENSDDTSEVRAARSGERGAGDKNERREE